MQQQNFIHFQKTGENNAGYLRQAQSPFIIGKVIKMRSQDEADNYNVKQVSYVIGRVPGFNIFITQAGFFEPPDRLITDRELTEVITDMCDWYLTEKLAGNKIMTKTFKIK